MYIKIINIFLDLVGHRLVHPPARVVIYKDARGGMEACNHPRSHGPPLRARLFEDKRRGGGRDGGDLKICFLMDFDI